MSTKGLFITQPELEQKRRVREISVDDYKNDRLYVIPKTPKKQKLFLEIYQDYVRSGLTVVELAVKWGIQNTQYISKIIK